MDRVTVFPGAIPLDLDILSLQQNTMIALGALAQAAFGVGTIADGLALTASSPASMVVNVGPGSIFSLQSLEATDWGSIAHDTADSIVKMGINAIGSTPFTLTAPGSGGQSINYLIEAEFQESDTGSMVLAYYNTSNPSVPYAGPNNTGSAQNTKRIQRVGLQLKAGTAAATGTQTTPAVDGGWVGLYVITVNFGQTTITSGQLGTAGVNVLHPTAPFINTKIPQIRRRLQANLTLYVNGTTGNDASNGLSTSTALATLNGAWNLILNTLDLNGFSVTVNVADGNYGPALFSGTPVGSAGSTGISFTGNTSTPANCTVSATNGSAFTIAGGAQVNLQGFKVTATGTGAGQGNGIYLATAGCVCSASSIAFDACGVAHVSAASGSEAILNGSYSITGSAPSHYSASTGANVVAGGTSMTITLTGTPAFSTAFANAIDGAIQATSSGVTYSGAATGSRYSASLNGVINTNGSGGTFFPGNAGGTTATGGQYA